MRISGLVLTDSCFDAGPFSVVGSSIDGSAFVRSFVRPRPVGLVLSVSRSVFDSGGGGGAAAATTTRVRKANLT